MMTRSKCAATNGNLASTAHSRRNGREREHADFDDDIRRFLRGEVSVVHFPVEDEVYKERLVQHRKLELENQKASADIFKNSFAFMKDTFGIDERE